MTFSGTGCVVAPGYPTARAGDAENAREGIEPDQPGVVGPIKQMKLCNRKVSRWRTSVTLWVRFIA